MNKTKKIEDIVESIRLALSDDIISLAELKQLASNENFDFKETLKFILLNLLSSDIEIGNVVNTRGDYVEFIAWRGDVDSRISRVISIVSSKGESEWGFDAWLSYRKNIDDYERSGYDPDA